ncbi:MAG: DegT/DnrJ/EryC1/StrS family aminotransferase [Bradymonadales bacterium]|nr:DegT/DnrJ/EryC1/StrS family aminotransferase [Bradymonadales bacterium]
MIRLSHPLFTREDWERLWPILESGMLVQGDTVKTFEEGCASYLEVAGLVAVSSGTAALHLALKLLGVGPETDVVLPSFTWPSAANIAEQLGAEVRLVDICPDTLNLDCSLLPSAVTPRCRAVVPVHLFGLPLDHRQVTDRVDPRLVVEDAACAFGASDRHGRKAGTWGRIGCFSLHARKGLTTGEGGLITARDEADLEQLRLLRNHGLSVGDQGPVFVLPGLNYRMNELSAALGLGQLARFERAMATRRLIAATYLHLLVSMPHIVLPVGLSDPGHVYQSFTIILDETVSRRELLQRLSEKGVQAQVGTYAIHLQPYYAARYRFSPDAYPVSRWAHEKVVALPMHEQMNESDARRVVEVLDEIL